MFFFFCSSIKEIYLFNVITKRNTGIFSASGTKDIYYISYIPIAFRTNYFILSSAFLLLQYRVTNK